MPFKVFLSGYLAALFQRGVTICAILVAGIMEQLCEIILNLDQWFRSRCCSKNFLSGALAALLFGGAEPFMQF